MRCEYCDVEVTQYPDNGICVCCGGKLPPRSNAQPVPSPVPQVQVPVYVSVQQPSHTGIMVTCPKCQSSRITRVNRGFSWGLAILGFLLIPGFGFLLGFCGSKKPRLQCIQCRHKWKQR